MDDVVDLIGLPKSFIIEEEDEYIDGFVRSIRVIVLGEAVAELRVDELVDW